MLRWLYPIGSFFVVTKKVEGKKKRIKKGSHFWAWQVIIEFKKKKTIEFVEMSK